MRMKHLIERCEREVSEVSDLVNFIPHAVAAGAAAAGAVAGVRAFNRDAQADNAERNRMAERGRGRCADGYHMENGKCVPSKGLGNKIKRARVKNFLTGRD